MFLSSLSHRQRTPEMMDAPSADAQALHQSLAFIRRINYFLGYTRATLKHLKTFSRRWKPGQQIRIVDLAPGSADIPMAILQWATTAGFDVRIVGVDRHPVTARYAAIGNVDPRLSIVQADVFDLPFEPASFDYATTAMFLHHLDDDQIVRVLQTMDRLATRGIIAADLLRRRRAYLWVKAFTLFSSPMVRHDAAASVAQALSDPEARDILRRSGLDYPAYHRHFGHRFVIAGEKSFA